ncbi:hypothetical protein F4775DRAFT_368686 [Biscogniauxia sp. FL1348]|nr:hypothetical protein F4775DRAFT_368686 [Biscogniauxia sp. FL1348]
MSGRSAHVRKKITEPNPAPARGRAKSSGSSRVSDRDDASLHDYPLPQGTGYGTTNARFLKFSESAREPEFPDYRNEVANFGNRSSGSQSGGSDSSRREAGMLQNHGPMPDFAYARARKPVLKTEDVSGIERSGFRSTMDKKSDEFRKGLTKAFTFGAKKKKGTDTRPPSAATIRPHTALDNYKYHDDDVPAVPVPVPVPNAQPGIWDPEYQQVISPPPSSKLPPIPPPSNIPPIKRWIGAGRQAQRWNKLRKDPELWDPNGDVLVYLGRKGQSPRPNPSFRLSSHIIEATESRVLITLLREGSTEDDYDSQMHMPPSPVGAPPMLRQHGSHPHLNYKHGRNGQPTPPMSEDASINDVDGQISYEMYFPTPPNMTKVDSLRYAITTRNVFALLYHASLVGLSLFQALSDLLARINDYMPPGTDNIGTLLTYLTARGIDDIRNDPETAISMLAWSETPEVRWEEGWREAFLHCAGMYSRLEDCPDFKNVTPITRALLERACLETQLRVQAAEERLAEFSYGDIWPATGPVAHGAAKAAADRLRQFFINHFINMYGSWPPPETGVRNCEGEEIWLSRTMAQRMQKDFGALYDYLVNRNIVWDESETRSSRKWMMVSENGDKSFDADTADLPLTDMLIEFDNRMRFPHIPHPYPLVPESISPGCSPVLGGNSRERLRKDKNSRHPGDDRIIERRIQLAYTEATNIYTLGSDFTQSDLVESFVKFEKADQIGLIDPFCARRGRWVLIYGILQTLASVSVDTPNIRYKEGVTYHLSPRLKGTKTPPWKGISAPAPEACHQLSHCWLAPRTWHTSIEGAESDTSINSGGGGTDPVSRMLRTQGQKLPRPPHIMTSRSSNNNNPGWQTTASSTRSNRSNGLHGPPTPTTWGGSSSTQSVSAYSDDTASSVRTPSSTHFPHGGSSSSQKGGGGSSYYKIPRSIRGGDDGTRSERSLGTFGHNDANWPPRSYSIHRGSRVPAHLPLDLTLSQDVTAGFADFLNLGQEEEDGEDGEEREDRDLMRREPLPGAARPDVLGPMIRDFDELDSVIEEHGFEKV